MKMTEKPGPSGARHVWLDEQRDGPEQTLPAFILEAVLVLTKTFNTEDTYSLNPGKSFFTKQRGARTPGPRQEAAATLPPLRVNLLDLPLHPQVSKAATCPKLSRCVAGPLPGCDLAKAASPPIPALPEGPQRPIHTPQSAGSTELP